jgi:hypothetical protein
VEDEFRQQLLERLKAIEQRLDALDGRRHRWRDGNARTITSQAFTVPAMTACAFLQRP